MQSVMKRNELNHCKAKQPRHEVWLKYLLYQHVITGNMQIHKVSNDHYHLLLMDVMLLIMTFVINKMRDEAVCGDLGRQ